MSVEIRLLQNRTNPVDNLSNLLVDTDGQIVSSIIDTGYQTGSLRHRE